jgi:hypothetical protein
MHRLSPIILLVGLISNLFAQSPHGADFKINCADCHNSESWEIAESHWNLGDPKRVNPRDQVKNGIEPVQEFASFTHQDTDFPLEGRHLTTDCRLCHESLVFSEAPSECVSCHTDMHHMTVGSDCARCHTVENWLVNTITELHQENGFPLLGTHAQISCTECHVSASDLQFTRLGNDCVNCHQADYMATTDPDHAAAGYSLECLDCHDINAFSWNANILHDFFPLVKGHDITDCSQCHSGTGFSNTPTDCIACHQTDYNNATNPNHTSLGFNMDCAVCHTLDLDWMPAEYRDHDLQSFPIYSGKHKGEWSDCVECHPNPADYGVFTCTTCHKQNSTNNEHGGVGGYVYESTACLACHPTGNGDGGFNHNQTNFPLTGAHIGEDCLSCHANGYQGTPTDCASCHTTDFQQTSAPDHELLSFPMDCASCHTTDPNWVPATFTIHNNYYVLNGAHAQIATNCAACHNSTFTNTPTTCVGCHQDNYNQSNNPNHASAGFPTDCESCHSENGWKPSTWNHDGMFPIYSGKHKDKWNQCTECHTTQGNFMAFSCTDCHEHNDQMDMADKHDDVSGYSFISSECYSCHPTGVK